MKVISTRNPHQGLIEGIKLLHRDGVQRNSRNGFVIVSPQPVTTMYSHSTERVILWPQRDANPFLHLYEACWMLQGRNDILPLTRYASNFIDYSDDGLTQHGAYGHRWRQAFGVDQLKIVAETLFANHEDRRSVVQMWDARRDLGRQGKDLPCNLMATFQINTNGALDLTVFCRSNDIVWGAYGANAVHFSILQEYMARWIEVPVGIYRQISVNFHAYTKTLEPLRSLYTVSVDKHAPYNGMLVTPLWMTGSREDFDLDISEVIRNADGSFRDKIQNRSWGPFAQIVYTMLYAHHLWKCLPAPERYEQALEVLSVTHGSADWIVAGKEWIQRRHAAWLAKMPKY